MSPSGEKAMPEDYDVELEQRMQKDAAFWVETSRGLDARMDFSPDSIQAAEDLIPRLLVIGERQFGHAPDRKAAFIQGVTNSLGAYLGETMRRLGGGRWTRTEYGPGVVLPNGVTGFPLNKVGKRLEGDGADDIRSFFDVTMNVNLRSHTSSP